MRRCCACQTSYYGRGNRGDRPACALWPVCPRSGSRQRWSHLDKALLAFRLRLWQEFLLAAWRLCHLAWAMLQARRGRLSPSGDACAPPHKRRHVG